MPIKTIAIQSPGDMGHGIGRVLAEGGYHVVSALEGRSVRTRGLAKAAGIEDIGGLSALLEQADVVLSIMRPDRALGFVEELASLTGGHAGRPVIVDLNAVAPSTGRAAASAAESAGLNFVDGGIIGGPPRPGSSKTPRLYVSGPRAGELVILNQVGLDFRLLGESIGAGSAIKMCYAALTKGLTAIGIHSMVTARLEGVDEALMAELASSQKDLLRHLDRGLPDMCPKAYRWIGEMEEISKTHADGGLPGEMFIGAAKVYAQVEASSLGSEIVEDRKLGTTAEEVARILADHIGGQDKAAE
jgi:3-hydroxyisobutyrate dehydrogenase-like beta-hydroxyacid dehydrogenase